jgi:hypothetical protein
MGAILCTVPHKGTHTHCQIKGAALNEPFGFSRNSKSAAGCVSKTVSWYKKYQTLLITVCDQRDEKNIRHRKFRKDNLQHKGATLYGGLCVLHRLLFANIKTKNSRKRHSITHFGLLIKYQLFICPVLWQFVSRLDYSGRKACLQKSHSGWQ